MLTVDLGAIAENWRSLRDRVTPGECGAVVKADAYGLGVGPVSMALYRAGCRRFFVATLDEGVELRRIVPADATIYVLNGPMGSATAGLLDRERLVPVLNSPNDIATWGDHARANGGRPAVLSLDTGMSRLGLAPADARALANEPSALEGLTLEVVMSHLACAEDATHPMNERQAVLFDALRAGLPSAPASLANSGGIFLGPRYHYDLARPGAALYGVSRSTGAPEQMNQVIVLKAKILQVRVVDSDSAVGYGATCQVTRGTRLATVATGYADGYLRSLSNSGHGYIGDVRVPVAGRISMDLIVFDISGVPDGTAGPGDTIELIGPRHTVDDLADEADTIGYEILTSLGGRYRRDYIGGEA